MAPALKLPSGLSIPQQGPPGARNDAFMIFAGAGASKAVRPDGYPTTVEFFKRMPASISADSVFKMVEHLLRDRGVATIDIEQVLWVVTELAEWCKAVLDAKTTTGWFVENNRLGQMIGSGADFSNLRSVASTAQSKLHDLCHRINRTVYEFYHEPPERSELETNWLLLLAPIVTSGQFLEIVTTNYDLVLEEAIEHSQAPVITGRTRRNQPTLFPDAWSAAADDDASLSRCGRLTKLHGSIDWVRGPNRRVFTGTPTFQGDHQNHVIVYPGFKGVPSDALFVQLHEYFENAVSRASTLLFIGYGFRDDYINAAIKGHLRPGARVIVLDPAPKVLKAPFAEGTWSHVALPFAPEGIKQVAGLLAKPRGEMDGRVAVGSR